MLFCGLYLLIEGLLPRHLFDLVHEAQQIVLEAQQGLPVLPEDIGTGPQLKQLLDPSEKLWGHGHLCPRARPGKLPLERFEFRLAPGKDGRRGHEGFFQGRPRPTNGLQQMLLLVLQVRRNVFPKRGELPLHGLIDHLQ